MDILTAFYPGKTLQEAITVLFLLCASPPAQGMNWRLEGAHLSTPSPHLHLPSQHIAPDLKHFLVLPNSHLLLHFAAWPDLCCSVTGIVG